MRYPNKAAVAAILSLTLIAQAALAATTYYIAGDGTGNDRLAVSSATSPWATLSKAAVAQSGDTVLFKTGSKWYDTLRIKSGVRYASYAVANGSTARPVISGAQPVGALPWRVDSGNVWVADASSVVKDDVDMYGNKVPGGISQLFLGAQRLTRARYPNVSGGLYANPNSRYLPTGGNTPFVEAYAQAIDVTNTVTVGGSATTVANLLANKDLLGADVFVKNNDWHMTRYRSTAAAITANGQLLLQADNKDINGDNYAVDRKAFHDLDWPGVTNYPILAGYGYWLEGKRWMLDQPGEWCYDPATKLLYVWLPGNASPVGASITAAVRLHAISGYNVQSVDLDGLEARETRGDAIKIDGFDARVASLKINKVAANNAGRKGINIVNTIRPGATIQPVGAITNSTVSNSINEGIDLSGDRRWAVTRTQQVSVSNVTVSYAGKDYYARGAILLGHRGDALNNLVYSSSYLGIHGGKLNKIAGNLVSDTCLAFDDCGAIYTGGSYYKIKDEEPSSTWTDFDVASQITNNLIYGTITSTDRQDGSGASNGLNNGVRYSTAGGIYLDDYSSSVLVDGNYVEGVDYGLALHQGSNNTISNNNMAGNRRALYLQENLSASYPMQGNSISGNLFATNSGEPLVQLQNIHGATASLASFVGNRYASLRGTAFAFDDALGATTRFLTFAQWQAAGRDNTTSSTLHATSFSISALSGATKMMNSGDFFSGSSNGWYGYHSTLSVAAGSGVLTVTPSVDADTVGAFVRYVATPPEAFAITAGKRYWVTFTAQADVPGELAVNFRKGDAPWTDQSVPLLVPVGPTPRSFSRLMTAQETNSAASLPFTFYIGKSAPAGGNKAYISNVSIIPAAAVTADAGAVGIANMSAGPGSASFYCPANSVPSTCLPYIDLKTGNAVSFPVSIGPKSSMVLGVNVQAWLDGDKDGIPNGADACLTSPDGAGVKETGCP